MKVSLNWLKELVDFKQTPEELAEIFSQKTVASKEVTEDFVELDMKGYNRADLLSLRGVAYEISAITNSPLKFTAPDINKMVWNSTELPEVEISGAIALKAPVYCLAKIANLKVGKSSDKLAKKLTDSGIRSVNNVADITNLIMLEYGQPLHAFDANFAEGIHVEKCPLTGWKFTTLDNKERILEEGDLLIRNRREIIGLAGVMGGLNSEVTENTNSIILEAAIFDPISIRKTASRLGLNSEASKRFQHGLTTKRLLQAFDTAIRMYQELGGELIAVSLIDQRDLPKNPSYNRTFEQMRETILIEDPKPKISLTQKKINGLIGIEIKPEQVEEYLNKLHFDLGTQGVPLQGWEVIPPYWRLDIEFEEDLIEEIARMYGYDTIPAVGLPGTSPEVTTPEILELIDKIKKESVNLGLTEIETYSYHSTQILKALGFTDQNLNALVKVANPMSSETTCLRQNIWSNLIEVIGKNIKNGFDDLALFEIGKVFSPKKDQGVEEKYSLSIAVMNGSDNPISELHSIFSKLNQELHLGIEMNPGEAPSVVKNIFHPKRFIHLKNDGGDIGGMFEVHSRILDQLGIGKRVAVMEIFLDNIR